MSLIEGVDFGAMVKPDGAAAAVPVSPATAAAAGSDGVAIPVAKPVAAPAAPTPTAPAAVAPATAPAPAAAPAPVSREEFAELRELQAATLESLDKVANALIESKVAAGEVVQPKTNAERDRLIGELAENNPPLQKLLSDLMATSDDVAELKRSQAAAAAERATAVAAQEYAAGITAESQALASRFPGLEEQDFTKVFGWMEENPADARRMSVRSVAEKVLGVDYLDARSTPPGVPAGGSPAPPGPTPASVVSFAGPGGAPETAPALPSSGNDVRSAFRDILADPRSRGMLGKYGT